MDCSTPGFPVLHHLPELAQTHVLWVSDAIQSPQSAVTLFSICLQSFPASGSLPMSQFFASGGRSTGASASVLSVNIQGWLPLGLTGLISLLSKLLSGVFSSTTLHLVLDSVLNGCGTIQGVSVFLLQPILMHLIFLESYSFLSFHIYENIFLFITFIRSF